MQSIDGEREVAVGAHAPVVPASVVKVQIALEAETRFADGRLDPRERVTLPAESRTPGPVGFPLFDDDVDASLRDLVVIMLTISDNAAADTLLDRVGGVGAINAGAHRLGLTGTRLAADLHTMIDSIGRDCGYEDWNDAATWSSRPHTEEEKALVASRARPISALDSSARTTTRTTAHDMTRLLRQIWADEAGPAEACARVRRIMAQQLTKHRLAAGFPPPARVAAKSGGLVGRVRNEIGVITRPDGRAYAAAVFTLTPESSAAYDIPVNAAIAAAAAAAVALLES